MVRGRNFRDLSTARQPTTPSTPRAACIGPVSKRPRLRTKAQLASRVENADEIPVRIFRCMKGGGIVVTTPSAPPMGTFYGAWKCKKSDSCNAVFYAFASDSTGNVALQRLSLRLHLTGRNSLAGTGEGSSCNLQGENCVDQPGGFRFTGKRITSREE
jgi:hypothetical protein